MNDFENEIYTIVAEEVRKNHPKAAVSGEYNRKPSVFPAVNLDEYQNVVIDALEDSSRREKYSGVGYRLQVSSNKQTGRKTEAKEIFATADEKLRSLGFLRKTYSPTPENYDSTIYTISATYEAIIGENGVVYKR